MQVYTGPISGEVVLAAGVHANLEVSPWGQISLWFGTVFPSFMVGSANAGCSRCGQCTMKGLNTAGLVASVKNLGFVFRPCPVVDTKGYEFVGRLDVPGLGILDVRLTKPPFIPLGRLTELVTIERGSASEEHFIAAVRGEVRSM